jgi:hypothetical protein
VIEAAWLSVIPVIANSSIAVSDTAALIQCQVWSCFSQKVRALRLLRADAGRFAARVAESRAARRPDDVWPSLGSRAGDAASTVGNFL